MFEPEYYKARGYITEFVRYEYDARDVFQNAAVKYYSNNPDQRNYPKTYFLTALKWAVMDYLRDIYKRFTYTYDEQNPVSPDIWYPHYEYEELYFLIISNAPQEIILYQKEYSIAEIAIRLNKTPNAVKVMRSKYIQKSRIMYNNNNFI